jgi:hypothetical protein
MVVQVISPTYFEAQCKRIKARREAFLDLVELQADAIDDFYETFHNVNEATTRRVQRNVKEVCELFDELVETSYTIKHRDIVESPVFPDLMQKISGIQEQCRICRLPLAEGLPVEQLKQKRWDCLHAEEKITSTAHQNEMLEDVLADRALPEYWNVMTTALKGVRYTIHDFYEALANMDTAKTRELIGHQRDVLKKARCEVTV